MSAPIITPADLARAIATAEQMRARGFPISGEAEILASAVLYLSAPVEAARPDVEAMRERADAATQGPWTKVTGKLDPQVMAYGGEVPLANFRSGTDAAFTAHARTDQPALLAYVARLEHGARTQAAQIVGLTEERDFAKATLLAAEATAADRLSQRNAAQELAEAERAYRVAQEEHAHTEHNGIAVIAARAALIAAGGVP